MYLPQIQKLIKLFSKFPTVGPRTAARFVFYIMKMPQPDFEELMNSILDIKKNIKFCDFCFNTLQVSKIDSGSQQKKLCSICSNNSRKKDILCIVEKEIDLNSIEDIKQYKGLYFILGGTASNIKKDETEKLRIKELQERLETPEKFGIENNGFSEIIIATNPTPEGEITALLLERKIKEFNLKEKSPKITRLGRGLPIGGELEYADEETLGSALEGRK